MTKWNHYNNKATEGKFLIKFLSKKNLVIFLDSGEVWFTRADKFGDKMECATIDDMKSKPFNFNKVIQRKQRHIISCWHHVGRESLAMWDTSYKTPEARRVYAIKFDTTLLIDHVTSSYFEESVEHQAQS